MEIRTQPMADHPSEKTLMSGCGMLPSHAPLANPFVPFQPNDPQTYPAKTGVVRGTLFPGLDLPFSDMVNKEPLPASPLHELQTLGFALAELGEYLDTHSDDAEAFALFQSYAELYRQGRAQYEAEHGPLTQTGAAADTSYRWLSDPWPWDYPTEKEA